MAAAGRSLPPEPRIKAAEGRQEVRCQTFSEAGKESSEPLSRVPHPKSSSLDVQFEVSENGGGGSNEAI